jgi:hypothetical protein
LHTPVCVCARAPQYAQIHAGSIEKIAEQAMLANEYRGSLMERRAGTQHLLGAQGQRLKLIGTQMRQRRTRLHEQAGDIRLCRCVLQCGWPFLLPLYISSELMILSATSQAETLYVPAAMACCSGVTFSMRTSLWVSACASAPPKPESFAWSTAAEAAPPEAAAFESDTEAVRSVCAGLDVAFVSAANGFCELIPLV